MARSRKISTDISTDKRMKQLAADGGVFAALLYTWMVPHATDDGGITADLEELQMLVVPGIKTTAAAMQKAVESMISLHLLERCGDRLFFPPETFYKYQSYVSAKNRRGSAENAEEQREVPQNSASPSLSPSLSPTPSPSPSERDMRASISIRPDLEDEPDVGPFYREFVSHVEQKTARPPSPIDKAEARRIERVYGTDKCREVATDFDWGYNPSYWGKVLEGRKNGNANGANRRESAAAANPAGVAAGVSNLDRLRAAVAARERGG